MKCDLCSHDAVIFVRYNGAHLCAIHFMEYVERRVKKEIRKQINLKPGDKIGVAVSGGKDSMTTLHLLYKTFEKRNDIEIHCITVDEGIEKYRLSGINAAEKYCKDKKIPFHLVSFKDIFGLTMDEVASIAKENSPCTYCGVFRRKCMNLVAKKINANYIATGHNLDDISQSILMNFVRGDVERLTRLGPHKRIQPGLIPRFIPLRMIPESESLLYAMVSKIDFCNMTCPYREKAIRNQYRSIINELDMRSPGSKFSILSSYDQICPILVNNLEKTTLTKCKCGEPSLSKKCKACELAEKATKKLNKGQPEEITNSDLFPFDTIG
ncbi:MAG: TIGR00269 family protein [archaeon]|nr:TIGR00269 family protein [archaeon]